MRAVWVAAPIALLLAYVAVRAARGRPLSRHALNVIVALFLLAYLATTAGLGVFWVARMDLPVFDWHYLFGYAVVALAACHVALQIPVLRVFFRRRAPGWMLDSAGRRFRPAVVRSFVAGVAAVAALAFAFGIAERTGDSGRIARSGSDSGGAVTTGVEPDSGTGGTRERAWIERDGERLSVAEFLYAQSSFARDSVLGKPRVAPETPGPFKHLEGWERVSLPEPAREAGTSLSAVLGDERGRGRPHDGGARIVVRTTRITSEQLSTVLQHTYGVTARRPGLQLRAAASAGALYPVDVYVAARRVRGLPPGLYYYHPAEHALVSLGGASALEAVSRSLGRPRAARDAAVTFVLGATFDRTVHKYHQRSYRYVALDTGHVAGNLAVAAPAVGWSCGLEPLFDDVAMSEALGQNRDEEGVLLAALCEPGPAERPRLRETTVPRELVALPGDTSALEPTRLGDRLTAWTALGAPIPFEWHRRPPEPSRSERAIGLPAPEASRRDVLEVIRERRSIRQLADRPMDAGALAGVLHAARRRAATVRPGNRVELFAVIRAVEQVAPGVYRYIAGTHELERLESGSSEVSAAIQRAGLGQAVLGRAAVVLVWALRFDRLGRIDDNRDFRHALLDAGLAGETAYLAATARGLGICGVGAFYDGEVNALIDAERYRAKAVYLMALGRTR